MNKYFHSFLVGISVLPALVVMQAGAIEGGITIFEDTLYENQLVENEDFLSDDVTSRPNNQKFGGYAFVDRPAKLTVKNSTYRGLTFDGSGAVFATRIPSGNDKAALDISGTMFENNHANKDGGAIGNFNELTITDSQFIGNTALLSQDSNGEYTVVVDSDTPVGGGAIALGAVSATNVKATSIQNTLFRNNMSGLNGGAIGTRLASDADNSAAKLDISATFEGNSALNNGGAIYNTFYADNNLGKGDGVTVTGNFVGNSAGNNGGAIYNDGAVDKVGNAGGVMTLRNSVFAGNSAGDRGGAIYNSGTLTVNGAVFGGNTDADANTADAGGAIFNDTGNRDIVTNILNSQFINNSATSYGGAIDHRTGTMNIKGSSFVGNHADVQGGAILLRLQTALAEMNIEDSVFTENSASEDGGAISALANLSIKNTDFYNNSVDDGGGAILVGSESITQIVGNGTKGIFANNTSGTRGGAIATRDKLQGDNVAAKLDISNIQFIGNSAVTDGGAIYNDFFNSVTNAGYTTVASSTFENNTANNGGAIYNDDVDKVGHTVALMLDSSTFSGNTATTNGGAIYNAGILTLAGTNSFSGNTANGNANDIYNVGTLTLAENSVTTMDGGINGDGFLTIAEGATLNIGTASLAQSSIALDGNMLATLRSGSDAQITTATFSGDGTLTLAVRGEDTYHIFGTDVFSTGTVNVESSVYDWQWANEGKDLIATLKSVEDIAADNELSNETAVTISNLVTSTSGQLNDLAVAIQEKLASGDGDTQQQVEHAHAAIHPETESVVQSVSSSVQSTVTSLAANRMAAQSIGRNGGDVQMTAGGVWAQGIFNKSKQNDAFSGYTRGIAGGLDSTFNKVFTLGAGYAFAHSDITGTARDTEIDSLSVFLYGQYKPTAWYMNAVANYTMADYSETGSALGIGVSADYGVDSFGANIATGYDFAGGVTPEFALRYMHINSADYISSLGIKNELEDANYLTASIGTKYAFDLKVAKHLNLRPELSYAIKYDLLSDKQVATVTMPGVNSYALNGERLSRIGGEFGVGIAMNYRGVDLSLNYDIEAREDYTSQSGRVKFRYNF